MHIFTRAEYLERLSDKAEQMTAEQQGLAFADYLHRVAERLEVEIPEGVLGASFMEAAVNAARAAHGDACTVEHVVAQIALSEQVAPFLERVEPEDEAERDDEAKANGKRAAYKAKIIAKAKATKQPVKAVEAIEDGCVVLVVIGEGALDELLSTAAEAGGTHLGTEVDEDISLNFFAFSLYEDAEIFADAVNEDDDLDAEAEILEEGDELDEAVKSKDIKKLVELAMLVDELDEARVKRRKPSQRRAAGKSRLKNSRKAMSGPRLAKKRKAKLWRKRNKNKLASYARRYTPAKPMKQPSFGEREDSLRAIMNGDLEEGFIITSSMRRNALFVGRMLGVHADRIITFSRDESKGDRVFLACLDYVYTVLVEAGASNAAIRMSSILNRLEMSMPMPSGGAPEEPSH